MGGRSLFAYCISYQTVSFWREECISYSYLYLNCPARCPAHSRNPNSVEWIAVYGLLICCFLPLDWCWEIWADHPSIFIPICRRLSCRDWHSPDLPLVWPRAQNIVFSWGMVMTCGLWFPSPIWHMSLRKPSLHILTSNLNWNIGFSWVSSLLAFR